MNGWLRTLFKLRFCRKGFIFDDALDPHRMVEWEQPLPIFPGPAAFVTASILHYFKDYSYLYLCVKYTVAQNM